MPAVSVRFDRVSFVYDSAQEPLLEQLSLEIGRGWTGVVGANGSGKTTLLRIVVGELTPTDGYVHVPGVAICCPQQTDDAPPELDMLLAAADGEAQALKGRLGLQEDWRARWQTLSQGERKRAQIAVALWQKPEVLLVDEPTNHIDRAARDLLAAALRAFRGVGLLVSHDRDLLDMLCMQCLLLNPPGAALWAGGYTKASSLAAAERERLRREKERAKEDLDRLAREAAIRAREPAAEHRKRSKSGLAPKDHDARGRINRARITDSGAGKSLRQLDGRLEQAKVRVEAIRVAREHRAGMHLPGLRSARNELFRIPEGRLPLGGGRLLLHPDLVMRPEDRIALVGPNGGGKSTLIRHVLAHLPLPADKLVYLAQEISREEASGIVRQARQFPDRKLGQLMSIVDSLGSQASRLLQTDAPSPGEIRKLLLALGMAHEPELIVMDEPTNHLDLPSIECMEAALGESCCALLLVSHDERFLSALTRRRWQISAGAEPMLMRLQVHETVERL